MLEFGLDPSGIQWPVVAQVFKVQGIIFEVSLDFTNQAVSYDTQ